MSPKGTSACTAKLIAGKKTPKNALEPENSSKIGNEFQRILQKRTTPHSITFAKSNYKMATAEFFLHKGSPTYIHPENADVMSISQFMAQNLRQPPPIPPPPKHTFEIAEGESVEIEKIVAAEKKVNRER